MQGILSTPPGAVGIEKAKRIVRDLYGKDVAVLGLPGERDRNFRVMETGGADYLLKISHPDEDGGVIDFQTQVMVWVERQNAMLPLQRVIPDREGKQLATVFLGGARRFVRLFSFAEGVPLYDLGAVSAPQAAGIGRMMAELDNAMAAFSHPSMRTESLWDITYTQKLRPLTKYIPNERQMSRVLGIIDAFESDVLPRLKNLDWQVIHSDLNPKNILVNPAQPTQVTGLIDFGDAAFAPRINNLAIFCAYCVSGESEDPLHAVVEAIRAYHSRHPLAQEEIEILGNLILARIAALCCIPWWRSHIHPDNTEYVLRSVPHAERALETLGSRSGKRIGIEIADAIAKGK